MNVMGSGLLIVLAILVVSGVIVGVALLITSLARRKEEQQAAQPQTVPAQVAARRTLIQQSGAVLQQGQAVLGYYVTFLKGDGNYVEFAVDPQQYALLTEGITGSLTFQGTQYLGFVKAQ